ncbi:MAG: protein kinase [Acidobacteria bacterium]|nr:protein kinase [Acidobacteriota bacterium]
MTGEKWQQINDLLAAALELEGGERADFLEKACAGDPGLQTEIESLLESDQRAESFMESTAVDLAASSLAEEGSDSLVEGSIGPYQVLAQLGTGGMGEVYLAHDAKLDRKIALKLLPDDLTQDEQRVRRFQQEARAASALNHPSIITIHDIGEARGRHYIAMEHVEGETLRQVMSTRRFKLREALDLFIQIASALAAAHRAGIVHRDIKPENIMLRPDGYAKVLDFGLAKLIALAENQTDAGLPVAPDKAIMVPGETNDGAEAAGPSQSTSRQARRNAVNLSAEVFGRRVAMGTMQYMSPEQATGRPVDHRTDLFSLGVVMYEMVSGRRPFVGGTPEETLDSIIHAEPEAIALFDTNIPPDLDHIIRRCLKREPEARYQSAGELLVDLGVLKRELETLPATIEAGSGERPRPPRHTLADFLRRRPSRPLVSIAVLLLGLAISVSYLQVSNRPRHAETGLAVRSLAVLPFKPLSTDGSDEHFGLGMADTLITKLSSLRQLIVRPTSAVRKYADANQDPLSAGREQQVDAVLESSLQRVEGRIRVTVRLLNVADGWPMWAYECDEAECSNIFALQDTISERVAQALLPKLTGVDRERLAKHYTDNREAYELYLRGRFYLQKRTTEGIEKSREYYREAIALDPHYALAYAGLAESYTGHFLQGKDMGVAEAAALKAVELDDTLAEAHLSSGLVRLHYQWNWPAAEREFTRALELNPNSSMAHSWIAILLATMERHEEALAHAKRAKELDPFSVWINGNLGVVLYAARDDDQAIEQFRKSIEMDPLWPSSHYCLGRLNVRKQRYQEAIAEFNKEIEVKGNTPLCKGSIAFVHAMSGRNEEALKILGELREQSKREPIALYVAIGYAGLKDTDKAFEWLDKAYKERTGVLWLRLNVDPYWDNLRSDARFVDLLRRVGLPEVKSDE